MSIPESLPLLKKESSLPFKTIGLASVALGAAALGPPTTATPTPETREPRSANSGWGFKRDERSVGPSGLILRGFHVLLTV